MATIVKRGDKWTARIALPPDELTGQRRQRRLTGPTKRSVEDQITRLRHELRSGTYLEPSREPLAAFLTRWLETVDVRASTRLRYDSIIRIHLTPALGRVALGALSPPMIARFYADLRTAGMAGSTLGNVHMVLRKALGQAVAWRLIDRNPTDGVTRPSAKPKRQPVWTLADARRFLDATADDELTGALWRLLAETGLRRSEALALDWPHVDLDASTLRVERTLTKTKAGWVLDEPKTESGVRTVALSPPLVMALRTHQAAQDARRIASGVFWQGGVVIFDRGDGARWDPATITQRFARLVVRLGMPHGTIHGLRRLSGRLMVVGRVPLKVAQQRLGHSKAQITLDLYASVEEELETDAAAVLGDLLMSPTDSATNGRSAQNVTSVDMEGRKSA
jgi:integrase